MGLKTETVSKITHFAFAAILVLLAAIQLTPLSSIKWLLWSARIYTGIAAITFCLVMIGILLIMWDDYRIKSLSRVQSLHKILTDGSLLIPVYIGTLWGPVASWMLVLLGLSGYKSLTQPKHPQVV